MTYQYHILTLNHFSINTYDLKLSNNKVEIYQINISSKHMLILFWIIYWMWKIVDSPDYTKMSTLQAYPVCPTWLIIFMRSLFSSVCHKYGLVCSNFSHSTIKDGLNYGFHQGTIPLTTPPIHFRVSDLILDIALIVPYSRVLEIIYIILISHNHSKKYFSDVSC